MSTVVCVLRSGGGVYGPRWVKALYRGVGENLSSFEFVCLTDQTFHILGVETVPLKHGWPGWWAKVHMFEPGLFTGSVVYLDLDTLPVGSLEDIAAYPGQLATLSDFYQPAQMASGVLCFTPSAQTERIWNLFLKNPKEIMRQHAGRSDYWYRKVIGVHERLQGLYPRQIVSLKIHAKHSAPKGSRLICGHGRPRLSDRAAGWANDLWLERSE